MAEFGVLSKFLNLKKAFNDATLQHKRDIEKEGFKQQFESKSDTASNYNAQFVALIGQGYDPRDIVNMIGPLPGDASSTAGGTPAPPTASISEQQPSAIGGMAGGGQTAAPTLPIQQPSPPTTGVSGTKYPMSPKAQAEEINKKIREYTLKGLTPEGRRAIKKEDIEFGAQKQLEAQDVKDVSKRQVNLRSAKLKLGNSLRSFVDVAKRTQKIVPGIKPGLIGGTISEVLGVTRANEFVEGFKGGLIEVAAAIGANAIPGARAVRIVNLFKKTGINIRSTIESAIQTTADSYVNSISTDMAASPWEYIDAFKNIKGIGARKKAWNNLTKEQQDNVIDIILPKALEDFENQFVSSNIQQIFEIEPGLLKKETVQRLQQETKFGEDNLVVGGILQGKKITAIEVMK